MTHGSVAQPEQAVRQTAAIDLGIVVAFFVACSVAEPVLDPILRRGSGLTGMLSLAGYQFACEGVAVVAIVALRREHLSRYGFRRRTLGRSLALAMVLACIYDLGLSWYAGALLWIPLRRHTVTRMSLAAGLPTRFVGLAITITVWGFFESFFGVFFARKLNDAVRQRGRGWLTFGTLGFALFNGLIHFAIGQGSEGFLNSFASGYAIAVIPALTGNAWGSVLFQTMTEAVGAL